MEFLLVINSLLIAAVSELKNIYFKIFPPSLSLYKFVIINILKQRSVIGAKK